MRFYIKELKLELTYAENKCIIITMKKTVYFLALCLILVLAGSCASAPETNPAPVAETPVPQEKPVPKAEAPKSADEEVVAQFEGVSITKKDKEIAKSEIEEIVKKLNEITAKKDYGRWRYWLSKEYIREYSKPEFLNKASENLPPHLKGKQLKSIEDYFNYVFVPSRQNQKFDYIQYISATKVEACTKEYVLYRFEKIDDRWLLVP